MVEGEVTKGCVVGQVVVVTSKMGSFGSHTEGGMVSSLSLVSLELWSSLSGFSFFFFFFWFGRPVGDRVADCIIGCVTRKRRITCVLKPPVLAIECLLHKYLLCR